VQSQNGTLLFDGDCGVCTTTAAWVARRWPQGEPPQAIAWQLLSHEELVECDLSLDELARAAWWVEGDHRDEGSRAVARALQATTGRWSFAGRILLVPPLSWIAALGYRVVARYRHRLPGGTPACKL